MEQIHHTKLVSQPKSISSNLQCNTYPEESAKGALHALNSAVNPTTSYWKWVFPSSSFCANTSAEPVCSLALIKPFLSKGMSRLFENEIVHQALAVPLTVYDLYAIRALSTCTINQWKLNFDEAKKKAALSYPQSSSISSHGTTASFSRNTPSVATPSEPLMVESAPPSTASSVRDDTKSLKSSKGRVNRRNPPSNGSSAFASLQKDFESCHSSITSSVTLRRSPRGQKSIPSSSSPPPDSNSQQGIHSLESNPKLKSIVKRLIALPSAVENAAAFPNFSFIGRFLGGYICDEELYVSPTCCCVIWSSNDIVQQVFKTSRPPHQATFCSFPELSPRLISEKQFATHKLLLPTDARDNSLYSNTQGTPQVARIQGLCIAVLLKNEPGKPGIVEIFCLTGPEWKKSVALPFKPLSIHALTNGILIRSEAPDRSFCAYTITGQPDARIRPVSYYFRTCPLTIPAKLKSDKSGTNGVESTPLPKPADPEHSATFDMREGCIVENGIYKWTDIPFYGDFDEHSHPSLQPESLKHPLSSSIFELSRSIYNMGEAERIQCDIVWVSSLLPVALAHLPTKGYYVLLLIYSVDKDMLHRMDHRFDQCKMSLNERIAQSTLPNKLAANLQQAGSEIILQELWSFHLSKYLGVDESTDLDGFSVHSHPPAVICVSMGVEEMEKRLKLALYHEPQHCLYLFSVFNESEDVGFDVIKDVLAFTTVCPVSDVAELQAIPLNIASLSSGRINETFKLKLRFEEVVVPPYGEAFADLDRAGVQEGSDSLKKRRYRSIEIALAQTPQYLVVLHLNNVLALYAGVQKLCNLSFPDFPVDHLPIYVYGSIANRFNLVTATLDNRPNGAVSITGKSEKESNEVPVHLQLQTYRCTLNLQPRLWLLRAVMHTVSLLLPMEPAFQLSQLILVECVNAVAERFPASPEMHRRVNEYPLEDFEWRRFVEKLCALFALARTRLAALGTKGKRQSDLAFAFPPKMEARGGTHGHFWPMLRNSPLGHAKPSLVAHSGKKHCSDATVTRTTAGDVSCMPERRGDLDLLWAYSDISDLAYDEDMLVLRPLMATVPTRVAYEAASVYTNVWATPYEALIHSCGPLFLILHGLYEDIQLRMLPDNAVLPLGGLLVRLASMLQLDLFLQHYIREQPSLLPFVIRKPSVEKSFEAVPNDGVLRALFELTQVPTITSTLWRIIDFGSGGLKRYFGDASVDVTKAESFRAKRLRRQWAERAAYHARQAHTRREHALLLFKMAESPASEAPTLLPPVCIESALNGEAMHPGRVEATRPTRATLWRDEAVPMVPIGGLPVEAGVRPLQNHREASLCRPLQEPPSIYPFLLFPLSFCVVHAFEQLYSECISRDAFWPPLYDCLVAKGISMSPRRRLPLFSEVAALKATLCMSVEEEAWTTVAGKEALLLFLVGVGMTPYLLDTLSMLVQIPIREYLRSLATQYLPETLPPTALELMGRSDLAYMACLRESLNHRYERGSSSPSFFSREDASPPGIMSRVASTRANLKHVKWGGLGPSTRWLCAMFPTDDRLHQVAQMLDYSELPTAEVLLENREATTVDGQAARKLVLASHNQAALCVGRGAFTLGSIPPPFLENTILDIPIIETRVIVTPVVATGESTDAQPQRYEYLHSRIVSRDLKRIPLSHDLWPDFHNGVATGLSIGRLDDAVEEDLDETHSTKMMQWITRHEQVYSPSELGGLLLGMGLNGHLKAIHSSLWVKLLFNHSIETVQTGLLLGLASSMIGSKNQELKKLCIVHLPSALPGSYNAMPIKSSAQCAALISLGLTYVATGDPLMYKTLLHQLNRPPTASSDKHNLDRESYALCAGWALGCIWLGLGKVATETKTPLEADILSLANLAEVCPSKPHVLKSNAGSSVVAAMHPEGLVDKDSAAHKLPFRSITSSRTVAMDPLSIYEGWHAGQTTVVENGTTRSISGGIAAPSSSENGAFNRSCIYYGSLNPAEVSAPASLAYGLAYLQTNDISKMLLLRMPSSPYDILSQLPHVMLHKVVARNLIMWDTIQATNDWVASQVPLFLQSFPFDYSNAKVCLPYLRVLVHNKERHSSVLEGTVVPAEATSIWDKDKPLVSILLALKLRLFAIGGALQSIGLKYAGTADSRAKALIMEYIYYFRSLKSNFLHEDAATEWPTCVPLDRVHLKKHAGVDLASIRTSLSICLQSLVYVMAGTGDLSVLHEFQLEHTKLNALAESTAKGTTSTYGNKIIWAQCLGILCLGGCQYSFRRDKVGIACLLLSFCVLNPERHPLDQRHFLPACRHLYALAAEKRSLQAAEINTGNTVRLPIEVEVKKEVAYSIVKGELVQETDAVDTTENREDEPLQTETLDLMLPCLMPEFGRIVSIRVKSYRYWPLLIHTTRDSRMKQRDKASALSSIHQRLVPMTEAMTHLAATTLPSKSTTDASVLYTPFEKGAEKVQLRTKPNEGNNGRSSKTRFSLVDTVLHFGMLVVKRLPAFLPHAAAAHPTPHHFLEIRDTLLRSLPLKRSPFIEEVDRFMQILESLANGCDSQEDFISHVLLKNFNDVEVNGSVECGRNKEGPLLNTLLHSLLPNKRFIYAEKPMDVLLTHPDTVGEASFLDNEAFFDTREDPLTTLFAFKPVLDPQEWAIEDSTQPTIEYTRPLTQEASRNNKEETIAETFVRHPSKHSFYHLVDGSFKEGNQETSMDYIKRLNYKDMLKQLYLVQKCLIEAKLEALPFYMYLNRFTDSHVPLYPNKSADFQYLQPREVAVFCTLKQFYARPSPLLSKMDSMGPTGHNCRSSSNPYPSSTAPNFCPNRFASLLTLSDFLESDEKLLQRFWSLEAIGIWLSYYYCFGLLDNFFQDLLDYGMGEALMIYYDLPLFAKWTQLSQSLPSKFVASQDALKKIYNLNSTQEKRTLFTYYGRFPSSTLLTEASRCLKETRLLSIHAPDILKRLFRDIFCAYAISNGFQ